MNQVHLCEVPKCGKEAVVFGFKGSLKTRSCREHLESLQLTQTQVFPIERCSFVSAAEDSEIFERRKAIVDKGRMSLSALEENCGFELNSALEDIESAKRNAVKAVEHRFEEMKAAVTMAYTEAKSQLSQIQVDLEHFLASKENQLSLTSLLICSGLNITPKFIRFGIADVSDSISAALNDCWSVASVDIHSTLKCLDVTQKEAAICTALSEAVGQAQKGIPTALQYADSLIGDDLLFEEEKSNVLCEIVKFEKTRNAQNLRWLQRSWDLRQRSVLAGEASIGIGQQLGSLLYHQLGQFKEAEEILRHCSSIANSLSPVSVNSLSICNEISCLYLTCAKYQDLEQFGTRVLETFESANLPAEHYWTAVLYLTSAQRLQSKHSNARAVLENWGKREFEGSNTLSEMLVLLMGGIDAYFNERKEEAEKCLMKARRIGFSHFPTSIFTALTLFRLSCLNEESSLEEQYHLEAQSIFEVASPKSVQSAINRMNLGILYYRTKQWDSAEECLRQAKSTYEAAAPKCNQAAINSYNLGSLYYDMKQWDEAEECYRHAQSIFEVVARKSTEAALNLNSLGIVYSEMKKWGEAEGCHKRAQSILKETAPKSIQAAKNYHNLGNLYFEIEHWREAENCYRQAQAIYNVIGKNSIDAAVNKMNLGILYTRVKRWNEAEACYRQAQSTYEVAAPKSVQAADNLYNLGILYVSMERWCEVEGCYRQAQSIYEVACPISNPTAKNMANLGILYSRMSRYCEAEACYRQAQSIYEDCALMSVDVASNLYNLGLLYVNLARGEEAEGCLRQAQSIYEIAAPQSVEAAKNCYNLGSLYYDVQRWREAEECYRQAQFIYEVAAPKSVGAANNLFNLGLVLEALVKTAKAIECYELAVLIYAEIGDMGAKSEAERKSTCLRNSLW